MKFFSLVDGRGNVFLSAYPQSHMRMVYIRGVVEAIDNGQRYLSIWQCTERGDLLRYDSGRTRTLTDKIVAARVARGGHANPDMQVTA